MIKYLVKSISVATENNPSFKAGDTDICWYGKKNVVVGRLPNINQKYSSAYWFNHLVLKSGYDRACDAKKNWCYKNPENTKYWKTTVEIIAVDPENID